MKLLKASILGLAMIWMAAPAATAAGGAKPLDKGKDELPEWSFEGVFGRFDQASVQRGFQVYKEVCSSCHGMKLLAYRNLGEPGGPFYSDDYEATEAAVKAFAADYQVEFIDDFGETDRRPATPADQFVGPFPNDAAARAANGGALPPDLSVIVKARNGGADYIYRLMTGYPGFDEVTLDNEIVFDDEDGHGGTLSQPIGLYWNPYFAGDTKPNWDGDPRHAPYGGFIAMPPQLMDGRVEYLDGTDATKDQMAKDLTEFLAWASEPKQGNRKSLGIAVMGYLFILAILLYFSYKRIWRNVDH